MPKVVSLPRRVRSEKLHVADSIAVLGKSAAVTRTHIHVFNEVWQHNRQVKAVCERIHTREHVHLHGHTGRREREGSQNLSRADFISADKIAIHAVEHELVGEHPIPTTTGHNA